MTGYHSASIIGEACAKKFTGIDYERAYKPMRKRNMDDDWLGLKPYRKLGYIPADQEPESVSKLIEYGTNDWAVSKVAEHLGHTDDAKMQRERSQNYKNVFDPKTLFLRAKLADGSFTNAVQSHRSRAHGAVSRLHGVECVAGDIRYSARCEGLHEALGRTRTLLDQARCALHDSINAAANAPPDIAGLVGQYAHGNEPSHHIAFLYIYAGQPLEVAGACDFASEDDV